MEIRTRFTAVAPVEEHERVHVHSFFLDDSEKINIVPWNAVWMEFAGHWNPIAGKHIHEDSIRNSLIEGPFGRSVWIERRLDNTKLYIVDVVGADESEIYMEHAEFDTVVALLRIVFTADAYTITDF